MSSKKVWFTFVVFFVLSFPFINFNFEYKKSTEEVDSLPSMVKGFLENQVSSRQLYSEPPYLWNSELFYSVAFHGEDSSRVQKKKKIDLLMKELSNITQLNLRKVEPSNANVKFIFSKDWRKTLVNKYPEFQGARAHTIGMSSEEYQKYWMSHSEAHYAFREVDHDLKELKGTTLLFNDEMSYESCQIAVNIARILMLPPHQMTSYTNTCREKKLPLLEETFLKVYYSKKYRDFIKTRSGSVQEDTVAFFMKEMMVYINQK